MDRERKAFEAWARREFALRHDESLSWRDGGVFVVDPQRPNVPRAGLIIPFAWAAWDARAALSRAPGEATEAATCADCGGMGVVEGVPPGAYPLGPRPGDFREYPCPACSADPAEATEAGQAEIRVLRSPDRHDEPASVYVLPGSTEASQPSPWYVCVQVFPDALSVIYFVRRGGVMIDREIPLSELRASVDAAPAEPTEAMVEAGAEAACDDYHGEDGTYQQSLRREWWRSVARACYAAMRAESEGGGAGREAACNHSGVAAPAAAPPSPGSDLMSEVEAFLRAIGGSEYIDTKDAETARELAGELRDLIEGGPNA